jgi:hypothetical protein
MPHYRHFYTPRRIAQLMISSALNRPTQTWDDFIATFTSKVDMFGKTYLKEHLSESVCYFLHYLHIYVLTSSVLDFRNPGSRSKRAGMQEDNECPICTIFA